MTDHVHRRLRERESAKREKAKKHAHFCDFPQLTEKFAVKSDVKGMILLYCLIASRSQDKLALARGNIPPPDPVHVCPMVDFSWITFEVTDYLFANLSPDV